MQKALALTTPDCMGGYPVLSNAYLGVLQTLVVPGPALHSACGRSGAET